jgi:hypothetical protein
MSGTHVFSCCDKIKDLQRLHISIHVVATIAMDGGMNKNRRIEFEVGQCVMLYVGKLLS